MASRLGWSILFSALLCAPPLLSDDRLIIKGAGATFPYPLYQRWFEHYRRETGTRVQYNPVGSGEGIAMFLRGDLDFGASDVKLEDVERQAGLHEVIHIPTCLGAVVIVFNLDGWSELRLTPELIASVFSGRINTWDDARLVTWNPKLKHCDLPITVVHRSDSSGTTHVFAEFLGQESDAWADQVGLGKQVDWPSGVGVEGNRGIVDFIKRIPGSVGYVELAYAEQNGLSTAMVRNHARRFVKANLVSLSAAGRIASSQSAQHGVDEAEQENAYPIYAFTYLIVYQDQAYGQRTRAQADALVHLLHWILDQGQADLRQLAYVPLPQSVLEEAHQRIAGMRFGQTPLSCVDGRKGAP